MPMSKIFSIYHLLKVKITQLWRRLGTTQNYFLAFTEVEIGSFRSFLPFYPPKNPKNQNFEKMKNVAWDIIILHNCTINDNHMLYGS